MAKLICFGDNCHGKSCKIEEINGKGFKIFAMAKVVCFFDMAKVAMLYLIKLPCHDK